MESDKYNVIHLDDVIDNKVISSTLSDLYRNKVLNKDKRITRVKKCRIFYLLL